MKPRQVEHFYFLAYLDKEEEEKRKLDEKKKKYKEYLKAKQDQDLRDSVLARGGRLPAKLRGEYESSKPISHKDFDLTAQDLEDLADELE